MNANECGKEAFWCGEKSLVSGSRGPVAHPPLQPLGSLETSDVYLAMKLTLLIS